MPDTYASSSFPASVGVAAGLAAAVLGTDVLLLRPRVLRHGVRLIWRLKVSVAILAMFVGGAVWATRAIWLEFSGAAGRAGGPARVGAPGDDGATLLWPGRLGGPGVGGNVDGSPLPGRGALDWQYPAEPRGETADAYVTAPVAAAGAHILVPVAAGPQRGLVCLPAGAGAEKTPAARWFYGTTKSVRQSPAVIGDAVLLVEGERGDSPRFLRCIGLANRRRRWTAPVAADVSGRFIVTAEHILIQDQPGALTCFDTSGVRLWSQPIGVIEQAVAATGAIVVAALTDPPALAALDQPSGQSLWRVGLDGPPTTSPAVHRSVLYVGTAGGLEARSLVDGRLLGGWKTEGGGVASDFATSREKRARRSASTKDFMPLSKGSNATPRLASWCFKYSWPLM